MGVDYMLPLTFVCGLRIAPTRTTCGMSTPQVISTTTTRTTLIGRSRIVPHESAKWSTHSADCMMKGRHKESNPMPKGRTIRTGHGWLSSQSHYQPGRKDTAMDDEEIIGYEALWQSMMKCKRGVMWKDSVANFNLNGVKEVGKLSDDLMEGRYKERPHKYFTVTSPKRREIMSISFRDRVYQRSLNDVAIYPIMCRSMIYDNGACQQGKGTDFARDRFKCHLQRFYRKHGREGYVLKLDIRGYYPNMRHDAVKAKFQKHLDANVYERAAAILDSFPGDVGFNPGSQIIQIAGISVLDELDHFIKERLRIKYYVRYMDDMLLIGETKEELAEIKDQISAKLAEIGFELHPKKSKIISLKKEIMFLGFKFRLTDTGKVVLILDPNRVKAERKKLFRMARLVAEGKLSKDKVDQCYQSWRNNASKGNSWHLLQNMDQYYRDLWR